MSYASYMMGLIEHHMVINNIIYILLIIIGGMIIIRLSDRFLSKIEEVFEFDVTAHYLLKDIVKYIVIIAAFAWILNVLGINLESIVISLGVVGIAIGIASQDIVSNFISGIFVIGDNKVKIGEVIEVDNFKGTVKKVGMRNTTIINQDNNEITIPNSVLSNTIYKLFDSNEDHRLRIMAVLPHGMNLDEFKKDLDEIMFSYDWVNNDKTTFLSYGYSEWGPKVEVSYWITKYEYIDCGKIRILENINSLADEYRKNNPMDYYNNS